MHKANLNVIDLAATGVAKALEQSFGSDTPDTPAPGNENKVDNTLKSAYRAVTNYAFDRDVHSEAMHKSKKITGNLGNCTRV